MISFFAAYDPVFLEATRAVCPSARISYHNHDNVAHHIIYCVGDLTLRCSGLP